MHLLQLRFGILHRLLPSAFVRNSRGLALSKANWSLQEMQSARGSSPHVGVRLSARWRLPHVAHRCLYPAAASFHHALEISDPPHQGDLKKLRASSNLRKSAMSSYDLLITYELIKKSTRNLLPNCPRNLDHPASHTKLALILLAQAI